MSVCCCCCCRRQAVRNFVQLCLEGYYEGCAFHRVIKDFMAQTGDPTNTGDSEYYFSYYML